MPIENVFRNLSSSAFEDLALALFTYQAEHNAIYKQFISYLGIEPASVQKIDQIPFLPIEFFKSHQVLCSNNEVEIVFTSSGTTGTTSTHFVTDLQLYIESFRQGFAHFYGSVSDYTIVALLPAYLEREGSSLIYMVNDLIEQSNQPDSGFYLHDHDALAETLIRLNTQGKKVLLIGVSFALLDLLDLYQFNLSQTIVMETGGMKGRRKELTREELHARFRSGFGVASIHSEYGMTELLSQGYSRGMGRFECPPWMKVLIRDPEDPLSLLKPGQTGGINCIDLANKNSCAFVATQDLGKLDHQGHFEVLGRFDHSDIRGCNLLV